ncbi:amidohydrolase family protein [Microbacterium sp. NPDC089698]|uniref:amidohydrolase family protein n=1 Tax=Microbacterium sp. NPDC089698 TaxID=3364200 RepID=UPI0038145D15
MTSNDFSGETETPWAGEHIIDCHLHERPTDDALIAHLDGSGVSSALVLAFDDFEKRFARLRTQHPGRIAGWARGAQLVPATSTDQTAVSAAFDMTTSDVTAEKMSTLRRLRRESWKGFAETTGPAEVDSPQSQQVYALAAELDVPVMMHFQESTVPGQPVYGVRGFSRLENMLKKFPDTRFIGHAPDFWGGIDARYRDGGEYLLDAVAVGGISDRLLRDYENMYGDLGAPSALIQLKRDPEFTSQFLERHQDKLMFGSDCGCVDGRGSLPASPAWPKNADDTAATPSDAEPPAIDAETAAAMQTAMARLGGLAGRCIARELLSVAWNSSSRQVFRKLAAGNARRIYRLD